LSGFASAAGAQTFIPQGPSPSTGPLNTVQSGDLNGTDGTVAGAVQSIVTVPGDPNTMYISGVNGGVWKTTNAGASWTPLTDNQASLSIASLALDPTDATNRTLIAGVGATSNGAVSFNGGALAARGGNLTGLLYSNDAGTSWRTLGGGTLSGMSVLGVAVRGGTILAATYDPNDPSSANPNYGLYRSVNGGTSFQKIDIAAGLGAGPATSLVGDPSNTARLFVATTSAAANASAVYVTNNAGSAWQTVFDSNTVVVGGANVINTIAGQTIIKLAAGPNGSLAAGVVDRSTGQLAGLYLSLNAGQTWTALTVPTADGGIHPGNQGLTNFAIAVDPTNPRIVYLAGDRQNGLGPNGTTFPNSTGAQTYTATVWRAVLNNNNSTTLASMTDLGAANGTTVHADSRNFAFDAAGRLILVGDGGIYARTQPQSAAGAWTGLNSSTLQLREIYGIGYDSVTNRLVVASQDTGAAIQNTPGSAGYTAVKGGDGTIATVNYTSLAGQSAVYTSSQSLGQLDRTIYDRAGNIVGGPTFLTLNGLVGGETAANIPFSSKFVLNRFDQSKIAVGTGFVYTTQDSLDPNNATLNLTSIGPVNAGNPVTVGQVSALAYGASDDRNAVLAGATNGLFLKQTSDATLQPLNNYAGLSPSSVVFGNRVQEFYAADTINLYGTTNKGVAFTTLTGSLPVGFSRPGALEFISSNGVNALLIGGLGAAANVSSTVAVADSDGNGNLSRWRLFGNGLPNAQVSNLVYNSNADALAVGTFGRGAFVLYDVTSNFAQATTLQFGLANNDSRPDAAILNNGTSANRPLVKYGTGTLTIAGAATYTGGTTINNGTLQIGNGGTAGSIVGNVAFCANAGDPQCNATANKALAFNRTDTSTFAGLISGPGQVFQNGTGTTILTGNSTYSGATTVNAGVLQVDGSITSRVTVNQGGRLTGTGTTGGMVVGTGAIIAPGDPRPNGTPSGNLRSNGTLVMQAGSAAVFDVGAGADEIIVSGTSSLAGTAFLSFGSGPIARRSVLISSQGGDLGTFDAVQAVNLPSFFSTQLLYEPDQVDLLIASNLSGIPGLNQNQQAVARLLDTTFNNGGGTFVDLLKFTSTPQISAALTTLTGESGTGSQQTTFQAMTQFLGTLLDPFIDGRGSEPVPSASSYAAEDDVANAYARTSRKRTDAEREAYMVFNKAQIRTSYDPHWSVWAAGFGGSQTTDGNAAVGTNAATSRIFGTAVGADYLLSPRTIAGFALAGGGTNFSVNGLGSGRSDLFQAGAFVRHNVGPAYLSGALAYGWQNVTTDRTVTIAGVDRLRAQFNANAWSGRLEGGYRFVSRWIGGVGITPYAAAQFTTFELPAYAESVISGANTFALAYAAKSVTDTRSELGIRGDKSFAMQTAIVTLRGRLAWAHDFNPDRSLAATFQTLPGASFVVNGAGLASDSALVTVSAETRWLNGWSAAASFEGEFSNVTASYAGKGVVRRTW
jgi:autotransporter-associated beta strand protein